MRARVSGSRGPWKRRDEGVRRAWSKVPGRKTNMKPPARKSCQSTRRTLVTRAVMTRPRTSKRISIADVEREPTRKLPSLLAIDVGCEETLLDRHLRLARDIGASPHHSPSMTSSLASSCGRYVTVYSRASPPRPRTCFIAVEIHLAALHGDDAGAQRRDQLRRAARRRSTRRGRRPADRADPAGCRSGTCRARRAPPGSAKSRRRFACSVRTPRMKNAPRPTASRMTRVWLPGRAMCSTACRSANERRVAQRLDGPNEPGAGEVQDERSRDEPAREHQPDLERAGLPRGDRHQRRGHGRRDAPLQPVDVRDAGGMSCRSSSDGLTCRTSRSGTRKTGSTRAGRSRTPARRRPSRSARNCTCITAASRRRTSARPP